MKLTIEISEERIVKMVEESLAEQIVSEYGSMAREAKLGVRDGVDKAIKAYIYSRKDEIIERCVNRATTEIVRKGVPKLIEKMEVEV